MDPIAEKIRISEFRINNGLALWTLPLIAAPVLMLAIGFMCGITIQTYLDLPKAALIIAAAAAIIGIAALRNTPPHIAVIAAMTAFTLGGMCRVYFANSHPANHINSIVGDSSLLAEVYGTVISEPVLKPATAQQQYKADLTALPYQPAGALSFYLKLTNIKSTRGIVPASGKIYVHLNGIPPDINMGNIVTVGENIHLYCVLSRPKSAAEKWQFDFKKYLHSQMVEVTAAAKYPAIEKSPIPNKFGWFRAKKHTLSAKIASMLAPQADGDDADGLLTALVLGRRTNLSPQVREAFMTTGLMHILSLSGMHVGILCGGIWTMLRLIGVRQRLAAAIVLIGVIFFLYVIPIRAPALRACMIAVTFACALIISRKPSSINTLAIAAIVTLLINPRDLFAAGWQLSFGCVLSILLLTSPIISLFHDLTKHHFVSHFSDNLFDWRNLTASFITAISVSAAACMGSLGILIYHFGAIYPYSGLYTVLLAIPIVITMNFSMLAIIVVAIIPGSETFMNAISNSMASFLITTVDMMAKIPHSEILTGYPPLYVIILLYAAMTSFGLAVFILNRRLRFCSYLIILVFGVCTALWSYKAFVTNDLRITFLPVGHGQCVVAELGGGNTLMIDCGSSTFDDCGAKIASPFLRSRRIAKIDTVIITHPHLDHINGLDYIVDKYNPEIIYANSDFAGFDDKTSEISEKTVISGRNNLEIEISPPLSQFESLNDRSLVTLITFGGKSILIPGDIEKDRQRELINLGVKADILVMPHHGSAITTLEDFAENINPEQIIPATPETSMTPRTLIIPRAKSPPEAQVNRQ